MKHLALVCVVLMCSSVAAGEPTVLFRSTAGFEVEIPKCWKPSVDSPDHDGPVESSPDVFFREGKECQRLRLSAQVPNGIAISSWSNLKSRDEISKAISARIAETVGVKSPPKENKANGTVEFQFVETPSKKVAGGRERYIVRT